MPTVDWQPDPTGRHESRRRNADGTWSDEVANYGVLSRDPYDGIQPEPVEDPQPDPEHQAVAAADPNVQFAAIAATVDQIQRLVGWILALIVVYLVVQIVIGLFAGLADPEPIPVILEYG